MKLKKNKDTNTIQLALIASPLWRMGIEMALINSTQRSDDKSLENVENNVWENINSQMDLLIVEIPDKQEELKLVLNALNLAHALHPQLACLAVVHRCKPTPLAVLEALKGFDRLLLVDCNVEPKSLECTIKQIIEDKTVDESNRYDSPTLLPTEQHKKLLQNFLKGFSPQMTAQSMGIHPKTISSHKRSLIYRVNIPFHKLIPASHLLARRRLTLFI